MADARNLRRPTRPARVADVLIGAPNPVVIQSMTTTPTLDTEASVAQTASIAGAGAQLVRLTAQGVAHAANLAAIRGTLREQGVNVPLVADIHFNPAAAFEAACHVEKVRINPGNFFDPGRTFRKMEFSDEEYAAELENIRNKFVPFLDLCKAKGTAIRVGVNHGSLSDRIMSRFGDGAEGMVESALEYLRICRDENFQDVVVSIKASDVPVMTDTVRLLARRMDEEGMHFPLHLGVTEAGNAAEGRIKSAVGIGSLLLDGIGDTIRVSLSEAPENEIPVARAIVDYCESQLAAAGTAVRERSSGRRKTDVLPSGIGGNNNVCIVGDTLSAAEIERLAAEGALHIIEADPARVVASVREAIGSISDSKPVIIKVRYFDSDKESIALKAAVDFGSLLLAGYRDGIMLETPSCNDIDSTALLRMIVQAAGLARYQAEIVACPGCGRTLFDLPEALAKVKEACLHLKHLKIAVMGCIVNGPGEMAGADYGYVGAGTGKVSLYRGIECVQKNIPQDEALAALKALIKSDGQWIDRE